MIRRKLRRYWVAAVGIAAVAGALALGGAAWTAGSAPVIKLRQPEQPEMGAVYFTHWGHQKQHKCYSCHPRLFAQKKQALFNHDDMKQGKYCAACHDGKTAFDVNDEAADCEVCHGQ